MKKLKSKGINGPSKIPAFLGLERIAYCFSIENYRPIPAITSEIFEMIIFNRLYSTNVVLVKTDLQLPTYYLLPILENAFRFLITNIKIQFQKNNIFSYPSPVLFSLFLVAFIFYLFNLYLIVLTLVCRQFVCLLSTPIFVRLLIV
jgi:hypothetical protein